MKLLLHKVSREEEDQYHYNVCVLHIKLETAGNVCVLAYLSAKTFLNFAFTDLKKQANVLIR